jgi:hypothetical protein
VALLKPGRKIAACVFLAAVVAVSARADDLALEYRVKAAFVFNFARFVTWPADRFAGPDAPLDLCVLGRDPFGRHLADVVRDKRVAGRMISLHYAQAPDRLPACEILFIGESESDRLHELLAGVTTEPVLTVSELPEFAFRGGMIRLLVENGKVRFEINPAAARAAGLDISSRLLSVARLTPARGY